MFRDPSTTTDSCDITWGHLMTLLVSQRDGDSVQLPFKAGIIQKWSRNLSWLINFWVNIYWFSSTNHCIMSSFIHDVIMTSFQLVSESEKKTFSSIQDDDWALSDILWVILKLRAASFIKQWSINQSLIDRQAASTMERFCEKRGRGRGVLLCRGPIKICCHQSGAFPRNVCVFNFLGLVCKVCVMHFVYIQWVPLLSSLYFPLSVCLCVCVYGMTQY